MAEPANAQISPTVFQWTQMVMNVVSLIEAANPSLTSCTLAQLLRPFMRRNQRSMFGYAE
jgi:hypothetical protein